MVIIERTRVFLEEKLYKYNGFLYQKDDNTLSYCKEFMLEKIVTVKLDFFCYATPKKQWRAATGLNLPRGFYPATSADGYTLNVDDNHFEVVEDFKYLGSYIGSTEKDVSNRIGLAWAALAKITQNESATQDEPIQRGLYLDPPLWMRVVASFN